MKRKIISTMLIGAMLISGLTVGCGKNKEKNPETLTEVTTDNIDITTEDETETKDENEYIYYEVEEKEDGSVIVTTYRHNEDGSLIVSKPEGLMYVWKIFEYTAEEWEKETRFKTPSKLEGYEIPSENETEDSKETDADVETKESGSETKPEETEISSVQPTNPPTVAPTVAPTKPAETKPVVPQTEAPKPTIPQTEAPTSAPTQAPTVAPTQAPTEVPTEPARVYPKEWQKTTFFWEEVGTYPAYTDGTYVFVYPDDIKECGGVMSGWINDLRRREKAEDGLIVIKCLKPFKSVTVPDYINGVKVDCYFNTFSPDAPGCYEYYSELEEAYIMPDLVSLIDTFARCKLKKVTIDENCKIGVMGFSSLAKFGQCEKIYCTRAVAKLLRSWRPWEYCYDIYTGEPFPEGIIE